MTTVTLMAEGNKHALKLLKMCADVDHVLLLHIDDMNIRGEQIWTIFFWYCELNFDRLRVCVTNRDLDMINFINRYSPGFERAVPHGGAPR